MLSDLLVHLRAFRRFWVLPALTAALSAFLLSAMSPVWIKAYDHTGDNGEAVPWGEIIAAQPVNWLPSILQADGVRNALAGLLVLSVLALIIALARRTGLSRPVFTLWLGLLAVGAAYQTVTPANVRHRDVVNHHKYVVFVADQKALPRWDECFICYHPPLYYLAGGATMRLFSAAPGYRDWGGLRQLALVLYALFLLGAARAVELVIARPGARLAALGLIGAFPSLSMTGVAIGNDALVYVFWTWALYWTLRWERDASGVAAGLAGLFVALGFMTKGNAFVTAGVLGGTALWQVATDRGRRPARVGGSLLALALVIAGFVGYAMWSRDFLARGPTGNIDRLARIWIAPNGPYFLYHLDVDAYLNLFAMESLEIGAFWPNAFLKTMLTALTAFPGTERMLMTAMAASFPAVILFCAAALVVSTSRGDRFPAAVWLTLLLAPAFSVAYRYKEHAYTSSEFRYVEPLLVAVGLTFGIVMDRLGTYGRARWQAVGGGVLGIFAGAGYAFQAVVILRAARFL